MLNFLADESNGIINVLLNDDLINYQNYFDLVFSFDVFEHLSDPLKQVTLINEALKCNGTCVICVPNKNSYFFKVDISSHPYFDYPAHLNYFSAESLKYMMFKAGFKDVKVIDLNFSWEKMYILPHFFKKGLVEKRFPLSDDWDKAGNGEHLVCIGKK